MYLYIVVIYTYLCIVLKDFFTKSFLQNTGLFSPGKLIVLHAPISVTHLAL